jgi:hypothetical protein
LQSGKIEYNKEELTLSVQRSRGFIKDNFPTLISLLEEERRQEMMLILYLRSRKHQLREIGMTP